MESKARQRSASVGAMKSDSRPCAGARSLGAALGGGGQDRWPQAGRRTITGHHGHKIPFVRMIPKQESGCGRGFGTAA